MRLVLEGDALAGGASFWKRDDSNTSAHPAPRLLTDKPATATVTTASYHQQELK
jgi:hypothetical protein